jgi:hypothetical protein
MESLTRRQVLGPLGIVAGSCVLSSCLHEGLTPALDKTDEPGASWDYHELDPDVTAERAYDACQKGHCMYGVFAPVMLQLAEAYGEPYRSFPVNMMRYGAGGAAGSGSLCGALNGSAALIGLFVKSDEEMQRQVAELFLWYEQTELPVTVPARPVLAGDMPKSVSDSVLCHVSTTRWCRVSGQKAFSTMRKERCRRLTADTARKTVEILNRHGRAQFASAYALSPETKTCKSCHTKGSEKENSRGTMSCGSCHFSMTDKHP